jgi:mannose-6-phosphate isomerase-like protein (cupin superfamily)
MDRYLVDFDDIGWESPMEGVRHKVREEHGRKLRLVEYSREMEPHWCARGHTGMILEGTFEIEFRDGKRLFRKGDGVHIPDGDEHSHRAVVLSEVVRAVFVEDS